jgi:endoglycosylceramidase
MKKKYPQLGYIAHEGPWLTDDAGRVAQMHGASFFGKTRPFLEDDFHDEDLAFLVSEGFNSIRVNWAWESAEPEPGEYDDTYLDRIVALNDRLARYGIRSLIGMTQNSYSSHYGAFGAPEWACINRYWGKASNYQEYFGRTAAAKNWASWPNRCDAEMEAWDNFYADALADDGEGILTHCINTWKRLASRFEGKPNV